MVRGSLSALHAGTIAMSTRAAQGRSIGSAVRVTLGDGTVASYRLVAVYDRGLGFGDTLLPWTTLRSHVDDPLAAEVLVRGNVTPTGLAHRLTGFPGLHVTGSGGHLRAADPQSRGTAGVSSVFLALIVGFSAIAAINTLAMATMDRSREFSLIRLVGATVRQVRGLLRWELALLLAIAAAIGVGAAWATLTAFSIGMTGGSTPAVGPGTLALILAGATAIGAGATFLPAGVLLRRNAATEVAAR